jgi:hypothetical protein
MNISEDLSSLGNFPYSVPLFATLWSPSSEYVFGSIQFALTSRPLKRDATACADPPYHRIVHLQFLDGNT